MIFYKSERLPESMFQHYIAATFTDKALGKSNCTMQIVKGYRAETVKTITIGNDIEGLSRHSSKCKLIKKWGHKENDQPTNRKPYTPASVCGCSAALPRCKTTVPATYMQTILILFITSAQHIDISDNRTN